MTLLKRILFPLILFIIPVVLYLIQIPYPISSNVKIVPAKEWSLVRNTNGLFNILLFNHHQQRLEYIKTIEFERGMFGQLSLAADVQNGSLINKGDTLASIEDTMLKERHIQVSGQIEITKARIEAGFTGEEEVLIPQAQKELDYARAVLRGQQKIFNRVEELFNKDLITREEYEIEQNNLELAKESVSLAEAQLSAIESGQEEAFVKVLKTELTAYQKEADLLKERLNKNVIISPISGKLLFDAFSDTIMQVYEINNFVGYIPLKSKDQRYVENGDSVFVHYSSGNSLKGIIKYRQSKVQLHQGEQIIINISVFDSINFENPGLILPCIVESKETNVLEYLWRKIL